MWSVAKALQVPLDKSIKNITDIPYTISFVIRKRQQIDNFNELSKDKRPPELMMWDGTPEELEEWIDKVFHPKKSMKSEFVIDDSEIE